MLWQEQLHEGAIDDGEDDREAHSEELGPPEPYLPYTQVPTVQSLHMHTHCCHTVP